MKFSKGHELIALCREHDMKIYEVMLKKEQENTGASQEEIFQRMQVSLEIMKKSVESGLTEEVRSLSGLIGGDAKKIYQRASEQKTVCGPLMSKAMSRAMAVLEVNAAMGKIVAAPTAGSCGILPGTLLTVAEEYELTDEDLINALITASAIGYIISKNATVSGAEGGCQAETGSAAAMAAGAIVEMLGGTPEAALHASAIAIKNTLGLVCDPVAGLVESPCEKRNGIGAANALISAEMVLAGVESLIPFDEVVEAMFQVGRSLPFELRESALGGLAATPTAQGIQKRLFCCRG